MTMKTWRAGLVGLLAGLLAACFGGGGSSGGVSELANLNFQPYSIDFSFSTQPVAFENAVKKVAAAVFTSQRLLQSADMNPGFLSGLDIVAGIIPGTENCTDGGFVLSRGTYADPFFLTLTVGDHLRVDYVDCAEAGLVTTGGFEFTAQSFVPDPFPLDPQLVPVQYLVELAMFMDDLMITDGNISSKSYGDVLALDSNDGAGTRTTGMSGTSLAMRADTGLETVIVRYAGFAFSYEITTAGNFTTLLNGTIGSSQLPVSGADGGEVSVANTAAFKGNDAVANGNPVEGQMEITGSGFSMLLTALIGGVDIRIQYDADGDGIYSGDGVNDPVDIYTTWAELEAL